MVTVYSLSTCPACKRAKQFLISNSIEFKNIEVDTLEGPDLTAIRNVVRKHNPAETYPTIVIGGKVIVGYDESALRKECGVK